MTDKHLDPLQVRRAFARAASTYERHDALQREVESRLFESLDYYDGKPRRVLDVGCGTGYFTDWYLRHGASVTGLDITTASVDQLARRFPDAEFVLGDVSDTVPDGPFDVVNAFDVLYHITDPERWERAVRNLARAVAPGGALVVTDLFEAGHGEAAHNVMRPLSRYAELLAAEGLEPGALTPTHVLLNRHLGAFRFLNRWPWALYAIDRALLALHLSLPRRTNRILVARRPTR